uniref:Radical SAM superfamily enzyme, MoaA/NifB/PqqE/SkfB family n=1 Tax=Candidatus Kentrum sp. LPFa TaxID=2126335 RepID=A0A450WAM2_9GAMM|nr:MAG: Radical SAM superfamily enzyme, MoaA/NifB/PqqE/SkfB family [Candidatus Kentron sp. LPFa]VFK30318.1 MAG: Radical SAM superfamily enzyme, MoaA/NifB/PqqE/SkfB family [Candidatus Kentron sp. LPFa]
MSNHVTRPPIVLKGYHWSQSELEASGPSGIFYFALNMTSLCNYRCPYCFVGLANLRDVHNELDLQKKLSLISESKALGARVVIMPGKGEPLIDKDFWTILEHANQLGMWVVLYTNAFSLSEDIIHKLYDAEISLYVKIDSFEREVYEEVVGRKDVFDKITRNMDLLLTKFHKPEISKDIIVSRLGVNSVVTVKNISSIAKVSAWCLENNIFYTCRSPVKVGEANSTWSYLVGNKVETLRDIGKRYANRSFTSATPAGQCGIYRYGITVENDGEIYVCPDAHEGFERIGNVKRSSLSELLRKKNTLYPPNSSKGFCFVKAEKNPEENMRLNNS